MLEDFLRGSIQLSPLLALTLLSFIPLVVKILNKNKEPSSNLVFGIGFLSLISSLLLLLLLGFREGVVLSLQFDLYGSGACALVALAALHSLPLFSWNHSVDKSQMSEIVFLFLNSVSALYIFCLAQDLITAFIGLEIASLVLYIIISMSRKNILTLEASIKYFVLSSFAGIIFLYGLSFLFGITGDISFSALAKQTEMLSQSSRFLYIGIAFIFAGLFFKMALFPFQFWLADVYEGALTPVTTFMATAVKASVILFIAKLFSLPFFHTDHGTFFVYSLGAFSILTALFGSLMALKQVKLKRLIAFSSLSHSGYLMMALIGIFSLSSSFDFKILFYYLLAYIFMTGGVLNGVQCLEEKTHQPTLNDLKGVFKQYPFFALCLISFLLSLAGIPPFFGFFAKISLLKIILLSQNYWILFWAFVASALGIYYYIKPITFMMQEGESSFQITKMSRVGLAVSFFFTLFGAFFFGIFF